jgi:hypothetical protein
MVWSTADKVKVLEGPLDTQKPAALEWALELRWTKMATSSSRTQAKRGEARGRSVRVPVLINVRESYRCYYESGRHATGVNSFYSSK